MYLRYYFFDDTSPWYLRYDVAHLLHMPHDSPALPFVLQSLDTDEEWNESNSIERGYKAAGLKRYTFAKLATYIHHSKSKSKTEIAQTKSDEKKSSSAFNETRSQPKAIKFEYPEWNKLQIVIKSMKVQKGHFFFMATVKCFER